MLKPAKISDPALHLAESAGVAVFVYDENGCVRAHNTAATRLSKAVEKEEERTIALHRERRRAAALRAM